MPYDLNFNMCYTISVSFKAIESFLGCGINRKIEGPKFLCLINVDSWYLSEIFLLLIFVYLVLILYWNAHKILLLVQ